VPTNTPNTTSLLEKIMRNIIKTEARSTDTSQDHEDTDWENVTQSTVRFLSEIGQLESINRQSKGLLSILD
jgi:hypothetical protein